jgi:hypothetical protein
MIAMLNRDGKEVRTGSKALAVENDFYTFHLEDGEKDASVEKALAEIDSAGAAVHAALLRLEFPLEPEQKISFSQWLGLQWVRGRSARVGGEELADKLQKQIIELALDNAEIEAESPATPDAKGADPPPGAAGPRIPIPDLSGMSKQERDELRRDLANYSFELPRGIQLLHMLNTFTPAALPFLEAEWHLLDYEEDLLLTSDEPIVLERREAPENRFLGIGPATADGIYVPISPSLCLAIIRAGSSGRESYRKLDPNEAAKMNEASIQNLWTQLFRAVEGPPFPDAVPPLPDERISIS